MFSALGTHAVLLVESHLDRVEAYRLHHVSRYVCILIHGVLLHRERIWRELERRAMRGGEAERASWYCRSLVDGVPDRVAPPSDFGSVYSPWASDFSDPSDEDQ